MELMKLYCIPWTSEEEVMLISMRKAGDKASYIAYKLNKTEAAIYTKAYNMKVGSQYSYWGELWDVAQRMKADGKSYKEIGIAIGKSEETVIQKFKSERKKLKQSK